MDDSFMEPAFPQPLPRMAVHARTAMHSEKGLPRAGERSTSFARVDGYTVTTALAAFTFLSVLAFVLVAYFFLPS